MVRYMNIPLEDEEFEEAKRLKDEKGWSWQEFVEWTIDELSEDDG